METKRVKIILSGGGTGGHIYPAVATAEALKRLLGEEVELMFVGAEGKMEMEKIPALGYRIEGLPITGLQRRFEIKNLLVPVKVLQSIVKARKLLKTEHADLAIGFGGYASAPLLWAAQRTGIPTMIQEQNSFAGVTNKILAKRAEKICVSYDHMEQYFQASKIIMTGNPLRGKFGQEVDRHAAFDYFGLDEGKATLLIVGGSLGTRTLNNTMKQWADKLIKNNELQVIWQNGKYYDSEMSEFMSSRPNQNIWRGAFIDRMDYAYEVADVVISRSGACSVSELCLVGKPTIFVPSPNVAEDHQTKNAMALVEKEAAVMVPDGEACNKVIPLAMKLLADKPTQQKLAKNIKSLAIADSADRVAKQAIEIITRKRGDNN